MSNPEPDNTRHFAALELGRDKDHVLSIVQISGDSALAPCYLNLCRKIEEPYAVVVGRLRDLLEISMLRDRLTLVIDTTVVGRPILDRFKEYLSGYDLQFVRITDDEVESHDGNAWRVPKVDVVDSVRLLLQSGRLRFLAPADSGGESLQTSLKNFQIESADLLSGEYELWREDDDGGEVLSVALACWAAIHPELSDRGEDTGGGG